jgi:hypothetical protein
METFYPKQLLIGLFLFVWDGYSPSSIATAMARQTDLARRIGILL